jgi:SAM-dependent methyltransferase
MAPRFPGKPVVSIGVPSSGDWPAQDLETVGACPVCASTDRRLWIDDLHDDIFRVAPGRWRLYRCDGCASAYLDPRPDRASIGRAYGEYFTHAAGAARDEAARLGWLRRQRRALANGYTNHRYGTHYLPVNPLGALVACGLARLRQPLDVMFRYLPKPVPGDRVLDVGCGNGDFLDAARDAGWTPVGLEPDPAAAALCQARGLDVRVGSLETFGAEAPGFRAVTLNHVIEHLHAPRDALARVFSLLQPDGTLYLDTPNADSRGASRFGRHWRGMEPPRHLVLFTPASLLAVLRQVGFVDIRVERRPAVARSMYASSAAIAAGDANRPVRLPLPMRLMLALRPTPTRRLEFITLTARKPSAAT